MPMDLVLFEYAAPPLVGRSWIIDAVRTAVSATPRWDISNGIEPWLLGSKSEKLRVSMVEHPISWLSAYWDINCPLIQNDFDVLSLKYHENVTQFLQDYLASEVTLSAVYNRYEATVVQKVEDQPTAMAELLSSLNAPKSVTDKLMRLPVPLTFKHSIPEWAWPEIRRKEQEVFDRYEYW